VNFDTLPLQLCRLSLHIITERIPLQRNHSRCHDVIEYNYTNTYLNLGSISERLSVQMLSVLGMIWVFKELSTHIVIKVLMFRGLGRRA
jgi:hypothetical protein